MYDTALVLTKKSAVTANTFSAENKRLYIVTGANQGGKSTFLRSLGQAQLMGQCGMPVGAKQFSAPLRKAVFSHFKKEEDRWMTSGKLDEELDRMGRIANYIKGGDLLLFNEAFAATNEREGSEIGRQITEVLVKYGVEVFSVTHLHAYAIAFKNRDDVQYLRAQRLDDGSRTFTILPGEPLETAFGEDLYNKIFKKP
jgi:DNA mismatch repair ATPase MutS